MLTCVLISSWINKITKQAVNVCFKFKSSWDQRRQKLELELKKEMITHDTIFNDKSLAF